MPLVLNCRPLGVCFPVGETTNLRSSENMTDRMDVRRRRRVKVSEVSVIEPAVPQCLHHFESANFAAKFSQRTSCAHYSHLNHDIQK